MHLDLASAAVAADAIRKLSNQMEFSIDDSFGDKIYPLDNSFSGALVKNIYDSMIQGLNHIKDTTLHTHVVSETIIKSVSTVSSVNCLHVLLYAGACVHFS